MKMLLIMEDKGEPTVMCHLLAELVNIKISCI
jgi:hypothetical protein